MYTLVAPGRNRGEGIVMDGDLFKFVLLGLVALTVIVLVAILASLGAIRKALEQRAFQAGPEQAGAQPAHTSLGMGTTPAESAAPAAGSGHASSIKGVLEQHGMQEAQQAPAGTSLLSGAAAAQDPTPQVGVVDSVFAAHADDPQEEPFQRDGRWWFRRGNELLLYDEATGQWQAAPGQTLGTTSSSDPSAGAARTQSVATTATQAAPGLADAVASYWKCPTCGAVNGSTAATCRMCFAARP